MIELGIPCFCMGGTRVRRYCSIGDTLLVTKTLEVSIYILVLGTKSLILKSSVADLLVPRANILVMSAKTI